MIRSTRQQMMVAFGVSALFGSCAEPPNEKDVEPVRSALIDCVGNPTGDCFTTLHGTPVAVGAATQSEMAVWRGCQAGFPGNTDRGTCPTDQAEQIVGEVFTQTGGAFGTDHPGSHIYSLGTKKKSSPAVANNTDIGTWLIVWQQDWSSTDSDIKGRIVTDDGRFVSDEFWINSDLDNEKAPVVTYVRDAGKWLVTYRRTHGSTTAITGSYVDFTGAVFDSHGNPNAFEDLIASGVSTTATKHTTSASPLTGGILLTWNDTKFAFSDSENFPITGTISTISGATGLVGAFNEIQNQFGIAWREGSGTGTKARTRTLPPGCTTTSCATAALTVVTVPSGGNGLNPPLISANGRGFGILAGTLPASTKHVVLTTVDSAGKIGLSNTSLTPTCSGGLQASGSLGAPGVAAVATPKNDAAARQYMVYDAFCNNSPNNQKVQMASAPTNVFDPQNFDVSD